MILENLIKSSPDVRIPKQIKEQSGKATPFLQWVGGKRQLLEDYKPILPKKFHNYHELFLGGGALFFELHSIYGNQKEFFINDLNRELAITYEQVRNNLDKVIETCSPMELKHSKEFYYAVRNIDRTKVSERKYEKLFDAVDKLPHNEIAARLLYLNKTCFNSIYRVNSSGLNNVPMGRSLNKKIFNFSNLRSCNKVLQDAHITNKRYQDCFDQIENGDLVFLDPPYVPESQTSNFVSYTTEGFSLQDQRELKDFFDEVDKKGAFVCLSNTYCDFITELYSKYNIHKFVVNRNLNTKANKRKNSSTEALIANF